MLFTFFYYLLFSRCRVELMIGDSSLTSVNGIKLAMMSIVRAAYSVLLQLVAVVKRMLCFLHIVRRRKNSGNILPLHADVKMLSAGEVHTSLPNNDVRLLHALITVTARRGKRSAISNFSPLRGLALL